MKQLGQLFHVLFTSFNSSTQLSQQSGQKGPHIYTKENVFISVILFNAMFNFTIEMHIMPIQRCLWQVTLLTC